MFAEACHEFAEATFIVGVPVILRDLPLGLRRGAGDAGQQQQAHETGQKAHVAPAPRVLSPWQDCMKSLELQPETANPPRRPCPIMVNIETSVDSGG